MKLECTYVNKGFFDRTKLTPHFTKDKVQEVESIEDGMYTITNDRDGSSQVPLGGGKFHRFEVKCDWCGKTQTALTDIIEIDGTVYCKDCQGDSL